MAHCVIKVEIQLKDKLEMSYKCCKEAISVKSFSFEFDVHKLVGNRVLAKIPVLDFHFTLFYCFDYRLV